MAKELEKNYNPADIEPRTYQKWQQKKYFHAEVDRDKKPFTIVMPPPNITGRRQYHEPERVLQGSYQAVRLPGRSCSGSIRSPGT